MDAATSIMRTIEERHAKALGKQEYDAFKATLHRVAALQQGTEHNSEGARTAPGRGN
ncbi:hypothetical protein [Streptomyces sp. NBC_01506]|uniref:hypothetical protein n=1 Tax=Streptomyces sp. NBC_01506 TaxID=2903887 RepID=UPI003864192E